MDVVSTDVGLTSLAGAAPNGPPLQAHQRTRATNFPDGSSSRDIPHNTLSEFADEAHKPPAHWRIQSSGNVTTINGLLGPIGRVPDEQVAEKKP